MSAVYRRLDLFRRFLERPRWHRRVSPYREPGNEWGPQRRCQKNVCALGDPIQEGRVRADVHQEARYRTAK